jgi:hypothetical protein
MPIHHLSHSTLADWKECGEKVRLRKNVGVKSDPSWSLVGGSLVHTITENQDLLDFGITAEGPDDFTPETWEAAIREEEEKSDTDRETWRAAGRASKEWPDKENDKWWLHHGPRMVRNWRRFITGAAWQVALTPDGSPAVEIDLDTEMGGVPFKGYIDRVIEDAFGNLYIVDLKTGSRDPMNDEQLGEYHVALDKKYNGNWTPQFGAYFMNRKGTTTQIVDLTKFADGRLEHDFSKVWTAIQADVFVPKVGPLCGSCGVRRYCRAVDGDLANTALPYSIGESIA